MSLLRFKGKVRVMSEEDMELEEMDMGIIAKSKAWVWRAVALPIEEVYKIISYSSNKSIVQMYDGEKILVAESFDELCERWEKLRVEVQLTSTDWPVYNEGDGNIGTDDNS